MSAALRRAFSVTAAAAATEIWGGSLAATAAAASSSAIAGDYDDAPGRRGESLLRGEGGRSWGWGATASVITERPDRVGEV